MNARPARRRCACTTLTWVDHGTAACPSAMFIDHGTPPPSVRVALTAKEVRLYEGIEESGDVQGLVWRVNETVKAHLARVIPPAESDGAS